jgi:hypothetical protein
MTEQMSGPQEDRLGPTLESLANAPDLDAIFQSIASHPVLLTSQSIKAMAAWVGAQGDEGAREHLSWLLRLLRDCAELGLEAIRAGAAAAAATRQVSAAIDDLSGAICSSNGAILPAKA